MNNPETNTADLFKLFTVFFSGSFSFLFSFIASQINPFGETIAIGFFSVGYLLYSYIFGYLIIFYLKKTVVFVKETISKYWLWYILCISLLIVLGTLLGIYFAFGYETTINMAANFVLVVIGGVIVYIISKILEKISKDKKLTN